MKLQTAFCVAALPLASMSGKQAVAAGDPEERRTVRLSDVGWTDITATTALASVVLEAFGWEPEAAIPSVAVTFASLENGDLDVFLGSWMPTMAADIRPCPERGTVK